MIGAMFGQAFSAEWVKALRQRRALFWAYGFTPLAALVIGIAKLVWITVKFPQAAALARPDLMKGLLDATANAHNPVMILFLILGAANLFAGEYRWSAWRYLLVRNGRLHILAAKLAVFVVLSAIAMGLFMAGEIFTTLLDAALNHAALKASGGGEGLAVLSAAAIVMLNLAGLGALVALASVFTRSLTGSIITIIVALLAVTFAETMAAQYSVTWAQAILPGIALNRLMTPVMVMAGQIPAAAVLVQDNLWEPLAVMAAWLAIPAAAAAGLFARQDLSRE